MIPEIFDIANGKVVVNENVLLIPELKAVHDEYPDPIPALSFLHFKYHPKGPYCNTPEEDKEDILIMDFPGEYTTEDPVMIAAMTKMESFMMSPTYRYYLDNKILLEKMGKFGRTATVSAGRDGNASVLNSQLSKVGKTITEFKQLEKTVQQELDEHKSRVRGEKRKAYDQ
jgi:hypothetical protein